MKTILFLIPLFLFTSCSYTNINEQSNQFKSYGSYFTQSYLKKEQGYDWVAVNLSKYKKDVVKIEVYSRADVKKRQTCSYKGEASIINSNELLLVLDDKKISIKINKNMLSIDPLVEEDSNILHYYCSGGASLRGDYFKF